MGAVVHRHPAAQSFRWNLNADFPGQSMRGTTCSETTGRGPAMALSTSLISVVDGKNRRSGPPQCSGGRLGGHGV